VWCSLVKRRYRVFVERSVAAEVCAVLLIIMAGERDYVVWWRIELCEMTGFCLDSFG